MRWWSSSSLGWEIQRDVKFSFLAALWRWKRWNVLWKFLLPPEVYTCEWRSKTKLTEVWGQWGIDISNNGPCPPSGEAGWGWGRPSSRWCLLTILLCPPFLSSWKASAQPYIMTSMKPRLRIPSWNSPTRSWPRSWSGPPGSCRMLNSSWTASSKKPTNSTRRRRCESGLHVPLLLLSSSLPCGEHAVFPSETLSPCL